MHRASIVLTAAFTVLVSSCTLHDGLQRFEDPYEYLDFIGGKYTVTLLVNRQEGWYYKFLYVDKTWEFYPWGLGLKAITMEAGWHLYAGDRGWNYDEQHTYSSLEEALNAAQSAGTLFRMDLGTLYRYQDGAFIRLPSFKPLTPVN